MVQDLHLVCLLIFLFFSVLKTSILIILGGADNVVVIWKSSGQGLLKYNHSAPIQKVCYNPTAIMLASCSEVKITNQIKLIF
jgi:hypothetical protein